MSYNNPSFNAEELQGNPINNGAPSTDDFLIWDGAEWLPGAAGSDQVANDSTVSGVSVSDALEALALSITNPPMTVVTTATTRTMTAGEDVQLVTAGGQTISLVAIPASGTCVHVKRAGTGGGVTTVDTSDAALIDGGASVSMGNNASLKFISDGTNWYII